MYLYPQELLPIKTYCQSRDSISVVPFWIARPAFTHLADWNARDRWHPSVQCLPHVKTSGVLDTLWAHCTRSWALPWSKMSTAILQNYQTMQVIISALIRPLLFNYYVLHFQVSRNRLDLDMSISDHLRRISTFRRTRHSTQRILQFHSKYPRWTSEGQWISNRGRLQHRDRADVSSLLRDWLNFRSRLRTNFDWASDFIWTVISTVGVGWQTRPEINGVSLRCNRLSTWTREIKCGCRSPTCRTASISTTAVIIILILPVGFWSLRKRPTHYNFSHACTSTISE